MPCQPVKSASQAGNDYKKVSFFRRVEAQAPAETTIVVIMNSSGELLLGAEHGNGKHLVSPDCVGRKFGRDAFIDSEKRGAGRTMDALDADVVVILFV